MLLLKSFKRGTMLLFANLFPHNMCRQHLHWTYVKLYEKTRFDPSAVSYMLLCRSEVCVSLFLLFSFGKMNQTQLRSHQASEDRLRGDVLNLLTLKSIMTSSESLRTPLWLSEVQLSQLKDFFFLTTVIINHQVVNCRKRAKQNQPCVNSKLCSGFVWNEVIMAP